MSTGEESAWTEFKRIWKDAKSIADREGFLHWEVAFPGVWRSWQNTRPEGGFDAVIGNPPWDRIKLQEVEWVRHSCAGISSGSDSGGKTGGYPAASRTARCTRRRLRRRQGPGRRLGPSVPRFRPLSAPRAG